MKKHLPPKEIGNRACEEFNAYAMKNGLTVKAASEKTGIERKSSIAWSKGGAPCAFALAQMAKVGIDVQYIITGKRAEPVVHAHWEYDPNANDWGIGGWCCSKCHFKNDILGVSDKLPLPIKMYAGVKYCAQCGAKMDAEGF